MISVPVLTLAVLVGNSLPVCRSKATTTSAATAQFFVSRPHQCGGAGSVLVVYFYVRVNGVPNLFFSSVHACACGVAGGSILHCIQSLAGEFLSLVIFSCGLFVCLLSSVC